MGEPRCSSSAIPRNLEQADLGRSTPPLVTLVYTETKMSTHKHSEAGNEPRSLSMIRYDRSMNATTQKSKDSHFWHLTPLPAHRQVHTSHTPTSRFWRYVGSGGWSRSIAMMVRGHAWQKVVQLTIMFFRPFSGFLWRPHTHKNHCAPQTMHGTHSPIG